MADWSLGCFGQMAKRSLGCFGQKTLSPFCQYLLLFSYVSGLIWYTKKVTEEVILEQDPQNERRTDGNSWHYGS
jgi:hypothetical protein